MNGETLGIDDLRRAFASLEAAPGHGERPSPDRVWAAVHGELEPAEVRELALLAARDPQLAMEWRLARELAGDLAPRSRPAPFHRWVAPALAAAAIALLAIAVPVLMRPDRPTTPTVRGPAVTAPVSVLPSPAELPRAAVVLRWTPGPDGSRYRVVVSTRDLTTLFVADGLSQTQVAVPEAKLAPVPPGGTILWRVEARAPTGDELHSSTAAVTLR